MAHPYKNIALQAAWQRTVIITNTARAIGQSVGEFTVGAMLTWLHRYHSYDAALKNAVDWRQAKQRHLQQDLSDMAVGLIGCGAVGTEVAKLFKSFGAKVMVYDLCASRPHLTKHGLALTDDLMSLIRSNDILSLHTGLTDSTRHMIGAPSLRRCGQELY